jgi:hypothetical protein
VLTRLELIARGLHGCCIAVVLDIALCDGVMLEFVKSEYIRSVVLPIRGPVVPILCSPYRSLHSYMSLHQLLTYLPRHVHQILNLLFLLCDAENPLRSSRRRPFV